MVDLIYTKENVQAAINQAKISAGAASKVSEWLYKNYPPPSGQKKRSLTGFLVFEGGEYPVKPLGRFANEIAGEPLVNDNPHTDTFRERFQELGFQLITNGEDEAQAADSRQKSLRKFGSAPAKPIFEMQCFFATVHAA